MRYWNGGQLIQWRWGSLVAVCQALLEREEALRGNWSLRVLLKGDDDNFSDDEEQPSKQAKVSESSEMFRRADQAVTSRVFWAYTKMLYLLHGHLHRISTWCEACHCHEWSPQGNGCPLRGRRCNEMADGSFKEFIDSCNSNAKDDFLSCVAGLLPEELAVLQRDFQVSMDLILAEAKLKTSHWDVLPWKLCALASDDESRARLAANPGLNLSHACCTMQYRLVCLLDLETLG